jgi:hypothetical protein
MATAPWRCSECGTINEPVANSCRTCGRWPSLFDLEASVVDDAESVEFDAPDAQPTPYRTDTFEPEVFEPEIFEAEPLPKVDTGLPGESEPEPADQPRRAWLRAILPIALLVYFALSFFFSDR